MLTLDAMQKLTYTILMLVSFTSYGQFSEFRTYSNGLIYDPATMRRLTTIVDSLNIKFKTCDLNQPYASLPQGGATFITW